jgi:uncharacterized membrane protein YfcA
LIYKTLFKIFKKFKIIFKKKNVMKDEQMVAIIFLLAGIIAGVISYYLDIFLSVVFGVAVYLTIVAVLFKKVMRDKKLINESFITFVLIWFLVWITLNSL